MLDKVSGNCMMFFKAKLPQNHAHHSGTYPYTVLEAAIILVAMASGKKIFGD